jgi:hypothetical protein
MPVRGVVKVGLRVNLTAGRGQSHEGCQGSGLRSAGTVVLVSAARGY